MKENFEAINKPCAVCGLIGGGMVTYHHLKTRKAHSEHSEKEWNLIPVCFGDHARFHNRGTEYMATKYSSVKKWLIDNGWEFEELRKKWVRYECP